VKYIYSMMDMPVRVVNAHYALRQIIEEVRKNYVQNKQYDKTIQIFELSSSRYVLVLTFVLFSSTFLYIVNRQTKIGGVPHKTQITTLSNR
jgi:hypothetical protein